MTTSVGATDALANAAGVPIVRAYRGPQDHPEMSRVANAVRLHNGSPATQSVAEMTSYYSRFDQAALLRDCALVEVNGTVVAYGRVSWQEMATGEPEVNGILNIDPAHRGGTIEDLLLGHAVQRAAEIAAEAGTGRPVYLVLYVTDRDPEQKAAAEGLGFMAVRSSAQLVRPNLDEIPTIALPEGFEIRPIAADDRVMHRRVWEAAGRAFAGSFGEDAPSEEDYRRWLDGPNFDPPLWRVAFHGDDIAAQILNYLDATIDADGGRIGWTESISTQPEFRRRGLARALLAASLRAVRDAGATRAALGVDLQNPNQAATLYQSMGFEIVSVDHAYRLGPFPRVGSSAEAGAESGAVR